MNRATAEEIARAAATLAAALHELRELFMIHRESGPEAAELLQHASEMRDILSDLVARVSDTEPLKVHGQVMLERLSGEFEALERDLAGKRLH